LRYNTYPKTVAFRQVQFCSYNTEPARNLSALQAL